jgi:hypothetical protein
VEREPENPDAAVENEDALPGDLIDEGGEAADGEDRSRGENAPLRALSRGRHGIGGRE